jgi:predicted RNase H-like HicB family nuclease
MQYIIILHPDEKDGGYWSEVPVLPGCGSQGATLEEAIDMARDAVEGFIASIENIGIRFRPRSTS